MFPIGFTILAIFNQNKYIYDVIADEKIEYNYISESPNSLDGLTYINISKIKLDNYDNNKVYLKQFNLCK